MSWFQMDVYFGIFYIKIRKLLTSVATYDFLNKMYTILQDYKGKEKKMALTGIQIANKKALQALKA